MTDIFYVVRTCFLSLLDLQLINENKNIFFFEVTLKNHVLMELLLEYAGIITFGIIFLFFFDKKKNSKEQNPKKEHKKCSLSFLRLKRRSLKLLLIGSVLFGIPLIIRTILYFSGTWELDMWIFNIIFICIFMRLILNKGIYKHQLYALILIFTSNLILISASSSTKKKIDGKSIYDTLHDNYQSYFSIVIFYIIYLMLSALTCSSQVIQKKLMDIYYISPFLILVMAGIICFFFTFIAYIMTSKVACTDYFVNNGFCKIGYEKEYGSDKFFDNFNIYIYNLRDKLNTDKASFYLEIFIVYPLYTFSFFLKEYFEILIIMYLNPNYVLISNSLYFSLIMVFTLIKDASNLQTILQFIGEVIAIIGYLFYVEIFEIKFCELNKNTKLRIFLRSEDEIIASFAADNELDRDSNVFEDENTENSENKDNNSNQEEVIQKVEEIDPVILEMVQFESNKCLNSEN